MISDVEKYKFLGKMIESAISQERTRTANILSAIRDDYAPSTEPMKTIADMRPWFEGVIAQRKKVHEIAEMLDVPQHRVVFALKQLGLTAPEMNK